MHRKQRKARVRGLMGRAWDAIIRRLADGERRRYDIYCSLIEAELDARWEAFCYGW